MKKLAFFVVILLSCTGLFSQNSKHTFGIELSPTAVSYLGDLYSDQKFCLGYSAGLTYRYRLNSFLSMKSGISFDNKGSKTEMAVVDEFQVPLGTMESKIKSNYLVLPVMASLHDKKDRIFISSGPYIGYLVSSIIKSEAVGDFPALKVNNTKYAEKLDFGWVFNLGYGFRVSDKYRIELGIREDLGLKNLAGGGAVLRTNALGIRAGLIML